MFQFHFHSNYTVAYTLLKKWENRQVIKVGINSSTRDCL
jgi:hypothetical protein